MGESGFVRGEREAYSEGVECTTYIHYQRVGFVKREE